MTVTLAWFALLSCKSPATLTSSASDQDRLNLERSLQVEADGDQQPMWHGIATRDDIVALVGPVALTDCENLLATSEWKQCSASVGPCVRVVVRASGGHEVQLLPNQCARDSVGRQWLLSRTSPSAPGVMTMRESTGEALELREFQPVPLPDPE